MFLLDVEGVMNGIQLFIKGLTVRLTEEIKFDVTVIDRFLGGGVGVGVCDTQPTVGEVFNENGSVGGFDQFKVNVFTPKGSLRFIDHHLTTVTKGS